MNYSIMIIQTQNHFTLSNSKREKNPYLAMLNKRNELNIQSAISSLMSYKENQKMNPEMNFQI